MASVAHTANFVHNVTLHSLMCVFSAELLDQLEWVGSLFNHSLWRCGHPGPPEEMYKHPAHASAVGASMPGAPFREEGVLHPSMYRWESQHWKWQKGNSTFTVALPKVTHRWWAYMWSQNLLNLINIIWMKNLHRQYFGFAFWYEFLVCLLFWLIRFEQVLVAYRWTVHV